MSATQDESVEVIRFKNSASDKMMFAETFVDMEPA